MYHQSCAQKTHTNKLIQQPKSTDILGHLQAITTHKI